MPSGRRIAIVHDWLVTYAGSERVLEQIIALYPEADLFAVADFLPDSERAFLQGKRATTTFIQRLPRARSKFRHYLALMPLAIEQLDLSGYDIVLSSTHAVAKGVITGPDQLHISYVYSPIRYAWDLQHQYLREAGLSRGVASALTRLILHYVRLWDSRTAFSVDAFVGDSQFIARRIRKIYRRDAAVIYPPVDVSEQFRSFEKEEFYLAAGRMVPYKRVPLIIEAFGSMPDKKLIVIGDGPEFARAKSLAKPNVQILGYQPTDVLKDYMRRARAFVFAAEEDFGIIPVEAQDCGTPVIAYGRGGALETIQGLNYHDSPTGVFFGQQSVPSIVAAVQAFERNEHLFKPEACWKNAQRFSRERFHREFRTFVEDQAARFFG